MRILDERSEILHSIKRTILEEKLFAKFMAMDIEENSVSESDTKEPPFEKITFNTDYKIKTSLEEPPSDLELKPLPDHLEYVFLKTHFLLINDTHGPTEDICGPNTTGKKRSLDLQAVYWPTIIKEEHAKKLGIYPNVMKCPETAFKYAKFLTSGVLTLWDHSQSHINSNIF
ncbi:hypothetical protein Tco_1203693 [Tanacetum coccineum]